MKYIAINLSILVQGLSCHNNSGATNDDQVASLQLPVFSFPNRKTIAGNCRCLTHWGSVTHICIGKLTIIGSDNGLLPAQRQAIIWSNAGILLIGPLGTNLSEILIGIQTFSFTKMLLKMLSVKWRPFCLSLNVLPKIGQVMIGSMCTR